jgi:hypothetical protein
LNASERRLLPVLAGVLALASVLRFTGLSWGLRHTPDWDERAFVESVVGMIRGGDLDQRFYEYPGLFFYVLYPFLRLLPADALASPLAYLVARSVVAASGVASVWLAYRLSARLVTPRAGVVAALLLAASPIDVTTAHMVRPDVVLGTLCLLALLAFRRLGSDRGDVAGGAALGAAASLKITGALLLPSFVLSAWWGQRRWRSLALGGLAAMAVWVVTTPALLIRFADLVRGFESQWAQHYTSREHAPLYYLRTLVRGLGPIGALLAVVGLWEARKAPRDWAPVVAFPVVLLIVLSSAQTQWIRLAVPALGAMCVVASLGFEALAHRVPKGAWALALLGCLVPLTDSMAYVRQVSRPGTRDTAVDWAQAHVATGGRILTTMADLGFDRGRFEVLPATGEPARDRLLARAADAVVGPSDTVDALPGLAPTFVARSANAKIAGPAIGVFLVPESRRDRARPVRLQGAALTASSNAAGLPSAVDGRLDTYWRTDERGGGDDWVQIDLPEPAALGRVELLLGQRPNRAARGLRVLVSDDGRSWRDVAAIQGRPEPEEQASHSERGVSQLLLFEAVQTRHVRVVGSSRPRQRWGFAEISLGALDLELPEAAGSPAR